MEHRQMLADSYASNLELLKRTLADFSEADMMRRPAPKANHAMWQLGHLVSSEASMLNAVAPGTAPALPAGFDQRFGHDMTSCDDAAKFASTKAQLLDLMTKVRQATIQWIKAVNLADLDKPTPESMRHYAPTFGHVAMLVPGHTTMHVGQMQVIRRALGKPVLY
jgi:uncharacterized damage-inducible protein DinB